MKLAICLGVVGIGYLVFALFTMSLMIIASRADRRAEKTFGQIN